MSVVSAGAENRSKNFVLKCQQDPTVFLYHEVFFFWCIIPTFTEFYRVTVTQHCVMIQSCFLNVLFCGMTWYDDSTKNREHVS